MAPPLGFGECSLQEQRSIRQQQNSQQEQQKEEHVRQSRTKNRSSIRTLRGVNHQSASPVAPPPNRFRDSLQRAGSPMHDPQTSPQRHRIADKSRSRIESPIRASTAAPPPDDFRDSVRHVERLSLSPNVSDIDIYLFNLIKFEPTGKTRKGAPVTF